jgi:hypothetical protein
VRLPEIVLKRLKQLTPIGEAVFRAERHGGSTWAPGGARLYWGRIYDRADLPTIRMEAIRLTWQVWQRAEDPVMAWLDESLEQVTAHLLKHCLPPAPSRGLRRPANGTTRPTSTRLVIKRIPVADSGPEDWPA